MKKILLSIIFILSILKIHYIYLNSKDGQILQINEEVIDDTPKPQIKKRVRPPKTPLDPPPKLIADKINVDNNNTTDNSLKYKLTNNNTTDNSLKYKLTNNTIEHGGRILYQIEALENFHFIKKGDLGGYVESEDNLSHEEGAWVFDTTKVFGNAKVYGNAQVFDNAQVYDNAKIYGNARVYGNAQVYGNVEISDNAKVHGNAKVYNNAKIYGDTTVSDNAQVYNNVIISGNVWIWGNAKVWYDSEVSHGEFSEDLWYKIYEHESNQIVYKEKFEGTLPQIQYKNETFNLNKSFASKEEIIEKALQLYEDEQNNKNYLEN